MSDIRVCPKCGSDGVVADEVDIGVGTMYGPAGCPDCGWIEGGGEFDPLEPTTTEGVT